MKSFSALLLCSVLPTGLIAQGTLEIEPNNTRATASLHVMGAQSYGDVTINDRDWYRINLLADGDLRAWTAPGFVSQIGDTVLALFDVNGALLAEVDNGRPSSHGLYSFLEVGNLAAGTYYLRVRGADDSAAGSYTLDVQSLPATLLVPGVPAPVAVPEEVEPNDPRLPNSNSTTGPLWANVSGNIAAAVGSTSYSQAGADYDFYKILVPAPGFLTATTSAGPAPILADTVLHFCNAQLTRLAFDDNSGPASYSRIQASVAVPGIYYFAVSGYTTGNYILNVDYLVQPLVGVATATVHAGGCGPVGQVPQLGLRSAPLPSGAVPERPILGTTFYTDLRNAVPNRPVAKLFNTTALATPFALGPLGAPGCFSEVFNPFVRFDTTSATGTYFWGFPLPADIGLIGLTIEEQVAVLEPTYNALGVALSNRVSLVVGISH